MKPNPPEALKFAKQMQSGEVPMTEENIRKLCKMAGVKRYVLKNGDILKPHPSPSRMRRAKDSQRKYYRPSELAKLVGESRSTVSKRFKGKPGVKIHPFGGPNRRTIRMMLISREAAKREYPDLDI